MEPRPAVLPENGVPIDQAERSQSQDSETTTEDSAEDGTAFVGFARIFSGTLKRGDEVFVLGPKHNPQEFKTKVRFNHRPKAHINWSWPMRQRSCAANSITDVFFLSFQESGSQGRSVADVEGSESRRARDEGEG